MQMWGEGVYTVCSFLWYSLVPSASPSLATILQVRLSALVMTHSQSTLL